jgi:hypothetical protein
MSVSPSSSLEFSQTSGSNDWVSVGAVEGPVHPKIAVNTEAMADARRKRRFCELIRRTESRRRACARSATLWCAKSP